MNPIAVYLTADQSRLFVIFQKHHELIERLERAGFFQLTDGKAEILVDKFGAIGDVFIHKRFTK